MTKLQEVEKEIERLRDLVTEKKKQKRRIEDALSLLGSNKADLLGDLDDLLSNLTYYYDKHKELS
jgi:chromosome segregation ATPase